MSTIPTPPVYRITVIQLIVLLALTGALLLVERVTAYSALLGGLIQIGPSAYFARFAYRYRGASQAHRIVQAMYRGETGKIVLSVALFASVFATVTPLDAIALFLAYGAMFLVHLVAATALLGQRQHRKTQH